MPLHSPSARPAGIVSLCLALSLGLAPPLLAQSNYATPYAFTVLAGTPGSPGSSDGTGAAAGFDQPYGLALDSSGNVFVADKSNELIRMITPAGVVTTVAGLAGNQGTTDGTGSDARFDEPAGLTVGSGGDIYVADTGNNTIRKIASGGVVSTLAGSAGRSGTVNGTGTAALFNEPYGVAIDSSGNLYVSELGNDSIREVTQGGVVTTFAGTVGSPGSVNGTGGGATFDQPTGIAIDGSGNLYVADAGNDMIRKITSAGVVTTLAGSPHSAGSADGTGAAAQFNGPRGVAVDSSGNVYVADTQNCTVRKITPAGVVTTIAGTPGDFANEPGTGPAAMFDVPAGLAVNSAGIVYVSSALAYAIDQGSAATIPTTAAPAITHQPSAQTISSGSTVVFQVLATGLPAPTYQWFFNGNALAAGAGISGVTGPVLVINGATQENAGSYYCVASNSTGSAQSGPATLSVSATTDIGRLVNISCRAQVGTGNSILIAGFAVGGAGTSGSEPLLVRASGPALQAFNVTGTLPDPQLQIFSGSVLLGMNAGWGGSAAIATAAADVGAFEWTNPSSHDSALLQSLAAGPYTAQVSGQSGDTGVALAEVYDATLSYVPASPRLVNISARVQVGTGGNILIAGFVVGGSTSRSVLIRASGPALAPFGVTGTLSDPELQLYSGSTLLGMNAGWGGSTEIANAAASVGAFAWTSATSADSALLVTLPPGAYTAQVSGSSGDSGVALVEVYEVP